MRVFSPQTPQGVSATCPHMQELNVKLKSLQGVLYDLFEELSYGIPLFVVVIPGIVLIAIERFTHDMDDAPYVSSTVRVTQTTR